MFLSDRDRFLNALLTACASGNRMAVALAIAGGAGVNDKPWPSKAVPVATLRSGVTPSQQTSLPLTAAVQRQDADVGAQLLFCGADANGDGVMAAAVKDASPQILQLLVDAGGDVNAKEALFSGKRIVFAAVDGGAALS